MAEKKASTVSQVSSPSVFHIDFVTSSKEWMPGERRGA